SLLDFKESDKMFEKYIMLATDLKAITVEDDIVSITDTGKDIAKEEPLHCECYKPRKIMVMLPPYVKPVQETVDRYNGWYWSGPEEYHEAYLKGKVDDFIPNQPWIDFTKILKPVKLRPEPIMVFKNITLPMNPGKTDTFRKEFRELMLECRQDDRDLVNSPSFFTNDHIGKLEKYTLVAEILKYLPELSQRDFAPLRLDKPRSEYTPKEKSWHKISVIANEVRALAPSNRLSAEPESSVSKRAWFGFLPERRHSKCWVKADMQSSEDFFVGSRNQNDLWVVKRITVALLGEAFQWLQDAIMDKRQRIFDYYKSDKGPALEAANKSWPMLSEIPDNKGYVIFGNREFKLIEIEPPSWHHKSDVGDDFFADTQIEFIKDKQRVELEKTAKSEDSKKSKVNEQDKDEEMMLIHQMKTDGKKFPEIIKYFQDKAKDNNDMDSKWFKENKKKLSNRYNYWLDHRENPKEKDHD
ncbi:MAG: hypothetical protein KGI08_10110, partial [Thaumarchaeota archaeon]|nr:hypothetical protein [Nitrososphaerota archaeon]